MCLLQVVGGQWPALLPLNINALQLHTVVQQFASLLAEPACADPHRQQGHGGLHKSPGQCALSSTAKPGQMLATLSSHSPVLQQRGVPWHVEQGS